MEYKVQNIEYRRTNPQSSLPTLPSHTPTYTNIILMDSWSISNPTGHPVRSQAQSGTHPQSHWPPCAFTGCTCNPTGISMPSQGCTLRQIPNQDAPLKLSPQSWILCFYTIYLTRDSTAQRVCSPGAGFNPPEIFVALWPTCAVLSRYVSSLVALGGAPHHGGLLSPRIFMVLGGMKAAFVPFPSPGSWRARRLDCADLDSRVWLASTRTSIA